jgi:hypothetical protein
MPTVNGRNNHAAAGNVVADTGGLPGVLAQIAAEWEELDRQEGDVVGACFRLGRLLAELRRLARRDWSKRSKALGIHPRVARRYVRLGESELARSGLPESDLLCRLPADLMKLEWLCRLTAEQLRELLGRLDARGASREKVVAAVKAVLSGDDTPARPAPDLAALLERVFRRLDGVLERLEEADPGQRGRVRDLLAGGLRRVERALATSDGQEPAASGAER